MGKHTNRHFSNQVTNDNSTMKSNEVPLPKEEEGHTMTVDELPSQGHEVFEAPKNNGIKHNWLDNFALDKYYLFEKKKLESGRYSKKLILLSFPNYPTAKAYFDEQKLSLPDWFILSGDDFIKKYSFHVMNLRKYIKK